MPMSDEQEKLVVGLMKKHKTDILTDGSYFAVDNGHSFGKK